MNITIKGFNILKLSKISKISKISAIAALLLSNGVIAQSYQSFSGLGYSNTSYSFNMPQNNLHSKSDSNILTLSSQYFFDERQALGPLKEFDYINTSSNVSASISRQETSSNSINYHSDYSSNSASLGGEWITHNVIIGASYSHQQSDVKGNELSFERSSNYYTATVGYLVSDDFVIRANYNDGDDGDDFFNYSASYNLQLADTDYVGFSYDVDEDFEIHNLSSRYFFGFAEQSYLVIGGNYTLDNRDFIIDGDYWGVIASYYYDDQTSVSVSYGEDDAYSVGASYFINSNYSVNAGYNSVSNDKVQGDWDSYYLRVSAQF